MVDSIRNQLVMRRFEERDLARAHELSKEQRWSHRAEDWHFLWSVGEGYVVERAGEVVGTLLYWLFGADQAAFGNVIVDPAQQRQGIGRWLVDVCLERLSGRTIHLIATDEGVPLYQKLGFALTGEVTVFQGHVADDPPPLPSIEGLRLATEADQGGVLSALDRGSGMDRRDMLITMLRQAQVAVVERDGRITGASVFRRYLAGEWVGPVVAPDEPTAQALTAFWLSQRTGAFVRVDWRTTSVSGDWLETFGLEKKVQCPVMRRGDQAAGDLSIHEYAILAQATS